MKNSPEFQANITEKHTSLSQRSRMFRPNLLKVPVKKLNLLKSITAHEILHRWFLRFPLELFCTYLLINLFTGVFVSSIAHIMCICIHMCKRYYFRLLLFWDGKRKRSKSEISDYVCSLIKSICLISQYYSINLFNYFLCIRFRLPPSFT